MCVLWFFETESVIKTQRSYRTQYRKDPLSENAIQLWLKQFKETGSVLHRKGAGRPSIAQEVVDRIQEAFSKSIRRVSLQLDIPQTAVFRVVHNN
jgi:transposase